MNLLKKVFFLIFFLGLAHTALANFPISPVIISDLKATATTDSVHLRFKLSEHVDYKGALLSNPPRFVIDFNNAQLNTVLDQPALHHSFLRSIHSTHSTQNLRLIFEFKQASKIKMTQLKSLAKKSKQQHELLLEFVNKSSTAAQLANVTNPNKNTKQNSLLSSENTKTTLPVEPSSGSAKDSSQLLEAEVDKIIAEQPFLTHTVPAKAEDTKVYMGQKIVEPPISASETYVKSESLEIDPSQKMAGQPFLTHVVRPKGEDIGTYPSQQMAGESFLTHAVRPQNEDTRIYSSQRLNAEPQTTVATVSPHKKNTRDIVIAIDPGHGGEDPGAIGQQGTQEKNIVLSIARELEKIINNEPGFHAILTRHGDYFIPLRKRLAIARHYKADMLIAVHADAYMNNEARGASVYSLSNRGATSEAARWLAEKENHSELLDGAKLVDDQSMLRSVLLNLQQTATTGASLQLGAYILSYLGRCSRLHHQRVEQAAFVVLKSPDISSLLVETGFISNRAEEALLNKPAYQRQLAEAITEGIKDYYHLKPPGGTFLAAIMGRN